MKFKNLLQSIVVTSCILAHVSNIALAQNVNYTIQSGDSLYKISQKYNTSVDEILSENDLKLESTIHIGQKLTVPVSMHVVASGDSYWKISQQYNIPLQDLLKFNNITTNNNLSVGQAVYLSQPMQSYWNYTVKSGDSLWKISINLGVTLNDLLSVNELTTTSILHVGEILKIPSDDSNYRYGEYLDWWSEARYVVPTNSIFTVEDFYTGKKFTAKRTTGTNHADIETLTTVDTNVLKGIWGGNFSWSRRPVLVYYNGKTIAASLSSMPHAGDDSVQGGVYTSWRSLDYGAGYNLDWVKNNGMNGVIDLHFLNSTRHKDGKLGVRKHQECIKISAGKN